MRRFALLAFVLTGCVSVGKTVLVPDLPRLSSDQVAIYLPGDSVPPHTRVAIFETEHQGNMNDATDVLNKLRSEAGKLGANGVVIIGSEAEGDATRIANTLMTGVDWGGKVTTQAIAILAQDSTSSPHLRQ